MLTKLATFVQILANLKGKRLVHCHGCFDFLHIGHIRHLQEAKQLGDILAVTVTADQYVGKGIGRPIFTAQERCEMLAALECVDYVAINNAPTAIPAILAMHPDFYVKGTDYVDISCEEFKIAIECGTRVMFTDTLKYSSTDIIERIRKC